MKLIIKILLTILSLISLFFVGWEVYFCYFWSQNDGSNEYKMIFIIIPPILFLVGIIRILISRNLNLKLSYLIQDFICAILLFLPLFINDSIKSMSFGTLFSSIAFIFLVVKIFHPFSKSIDISNSNALN